MFSCTGMAAVVIGHPLDTIKVRQQVKDEKHFKTFARCTQETFAHEGVSDNTAIETHA